MSETSKQVIELIERFDRNIESYRNQTYNETQLRREFIDPFFEALGWDVTNRAGYAEAYKDVIHEDAIKIGSATKAPDYCFRIGGVRKFFVETKKPAINVKEDISPAYQLRRYAWSAKLPLSILTDFEEFAVYDCRMPPKPTDKPAIGRILYLTYKDYADHWDEISSIFSKEAVLRGSFDRFAESGKGKRGTSQVDAEFLTEIESWRETLARNLALRNPDLSVRDLNFAVQRTIDRIIFLRMCEDRGIEPYGQLLSLLNGENIYERLRYLYGLADDRYNSGLFHFKPEKERAEAPDGLTPTLTIDDKVLKDIIRRLYYPESPYEFSVLRADILGNVYEQFLGKVIRLTAGHRAIIEEKPEVKKAGGVYYTPSYIVDYIVKNTVGKLCEGKTPKQIAKLRILDPACGSGSFLIGAYTYLLNYHRDWYVKDGPEKHTKEIYKGAGGQWLLATQEKRRILLNNIYGVDIDSQAVEVTKLSLLLKVLEGENQETLSKQLRMWRERALPDLGNNIKCGNSLIGPDYYEGLQASIFNDEEIRRVNAFDWKAEFPAIFPSTSGRGKGEGGFDVVIGNPPYGAGLSSTEIDYLRIKYGTAKYQIDTYPLFIEKAYFLGKHESYAGMIIPSAWVASKYSEILRQLIATRTTLKNVVIAPQNTFTNATVETLILISIKREPKTESFLVERWDNGEKTSYYLNQSDILNQKECIFPVYSNPLILRLIKKIRSYSTSLSEYATAVWGAKIYQKGKGKPSQNGTESEAKIFHTQVKKKNTHKPLLGGKEIMRYKFEWKGTYVDYGEWLAEPRTLEWFDGSRILVREVTDKGIIQATIVNEEFVFSNSVDGIKLKDEKYSLAFILGLINSKLISFYHLNTSANAFKGAFPKVLIKDLLNIPIRLIDFSDPLGKTKHDRMVTLVECMLDIHKRLKDARLPDDKTQLQRQIEATDKQIDQLVYELYGLTEEEIRIVEVAT